MARPAPSDLQSPPVSAHEQSERPAGAPDHLEEAGLLALHAQLVLIRRFEERTAELFKAGEVVGTAHSSVGQEAVAVGAGAVLRPDDFIAGHHRSHGHVLAKGADPARMMAELLGRSTGYCSGFGGSMHIADLELGVLGCNGVVGAGAPIACGAGLSAQQRGTDQVAVAFFGDGAAAQGLSHEAFNLAAVWRLPVVFLCENNQFALSAEWRETRVVEDIAERAAGYGMPSEIVDGNDVLAVRDAVGRAVARARAGEGPTLVEAKTYRRLEHSMRANLPDTRDRAVAREWEQRDPLQRFERLLEERGVGAQRLRRSAAAASAQVEQAIEDARADPVAEPAALLDAVYAPHRGHPPAPGAGTRTLRYTAALREALEQEMEADERVVLLGEDIGRLGGIFTATQGLWERFGAGRVRNTPISEGGFVGAAVGAAMTGLRPVVEIQIFDFVTLAMDALVNQAAKLRFMMGGRASIPLVVRGPSGGGVRLAAQHSQSLEAWFAHVPGLVVVAPSGPADAKGLLAAAIQDDNPVVFLEAKSLLFSSRRCPRSATRSPWAPRRSSDPAPTSRWSRPRAWCRSPCGPRPACRGRGSTSRWSIRGRSIPWTARRSCARWPRPTGRSSSTRRWASAASGRRSRR
jgi:2-oxoisovalerate dehydrogenase E1 component